MPKVTVVTLPAKMLEEHQQVVGKSKTVGKLPLSVVFHKMYVKLISLLSGRSVLISILAFLLGRVFVMGEFAPVGLAFFAAVAQVDRKRTLSVGLWSITGVASGGYYTEVCIYALVMGLYFYWAEGLNKLNKKIAIMPIFIFFAVVCGGLVAILFKEVTLYNGLLVLFEAGTCMILSYIFIYCVPLLINKQGHLNQEDLTNERLSCMVILLATAVAGLGNIMVIDYSIRNMAGSFDYGHRPGRWGGL